MNDKGEDKGSLLNSFENLPTELLQGPIGKFMSTEDLLALSKVSSTLFFTYCDRLATTLLSHIVKGEEAEALKMIAAKPSLLCTRAKATDYSGRSYKDVTPFQAALLCHDSTMMLKMEPYFDKLPNGAAEKLSQFRQLFPDGLPQQKPYDFTWIIQVFSESQDDDLEAAFRRENNNTPFDQALKKFRETFTDLVMKEIFFNPSHFITALKIYDTQFKSWSDTQRNSFWGTIVGYTQRFLPACYAQAICQGLYLILKEKKPLSRSFNFTYNNGEYYPLTNSYFSLGFNFAVWWPPEQPPPFRQLPGCAGTLAHPTDPGEGERLASGFDQLCRASKAELLRLERRIRHVEAPYWSWCAIS